MNASVEFQMRQAMEARHAREMSELRLLIAASANTNAVLQAHLAERDATIQAIQHVVEAARGVVPNYTTRNMLSMSDPMERLAIALDALDGETR